MRAHIERWQSLTLSPADRAILDQMEEEMAESWHPIETAPKDGSRILLFQPTPARYIADGFKGGNEHGQMQEIWMGKWVDPDDEEGYWGDHGDNAKLLSDPTHWCELPDPPSAVT